jgi:probable F420-dependent oxidoreductase
VNRRARSAEAIHGLEFGFALPSRGPLATPRTLIRVALTAEALRYSCVTVSDHIVLPARTSSPYPYHPSGEMPGGAQQAYFEPLALMGWVLAATKRLRVGTSVLVVPYRNPVVTAKQVAVLDVLSNGRTFLGCGAGWWPEEFEALQAPPFAERGAVTDEYLRVMVELWTKDAPSFDGKYYRIRDVTMLPKPTQQPHPPLWIGGHTRPALRRAGELGDAWHPIGLRPPAGLEPDEYAEKAREVREHAVRAGRDRNAVRLTLRAPLEVWPTPSRRSKTPPRTEIGPLRGTADKVVEDLRAYQRVGVRSFVFDFTDPDPNAAVETMRRFAREVRPRVARLR